MINSSECKCSRCVEACRRPAHTEPDDDYWIAELLKVSKKQVLKKFTETPIAIIKLNGQKFVMKGLRPKTENGWCVFFKNGLCTIHSVKPFGCKYASCKTTPVEEKEVLDYLAQKWYIRNLAHDKLEVFDVKNVEQQREIRKLTKERLEAGGLLH